MHRRELYTARSFIDPGRSFLLCRCDSCGLVSADLTPEDIAGAYDADYYKTAYPDYELDAKIHARNAEIVLDRIERLIEPGRLIEVGSAFGFFLQVASRRGWRITGYEMSDHAASIARERYGLDVRAEDFGVASIEGEADLVVMLDTIEHLLEPGAMIDKCSRTLRAGGLLYLTTGDLDSLFAKICGHRWRMIAPPLHVYYFTPDILRRLLGKYGLEVVQIVHPPKYHDIASIVRYFSRGRISLPWSLPIPVNVGDTMAVLARKE
jgi:SAM-dependent methyltransferase